MSNCVANQTIGYITTQFKKWDHLSLDEKKSLLDVNNHHMDYALTMLSNVSPTEMLWINGYLEQTPYGYSNYATEMNKLLSLGSLATRDDVDRFNQAGDQLANSMINAHLNYMLANSSSVDSFQSIINQFLNDSDSVEVKVYQLKLLKEGMEDVDKQLGKIADQMTVSSSAMIGTGSAMIIAGIICCIAGAANLAVLGAGIGLIIAGVILVVTGSPNAHIADTINRLRDEMKPGLNNFSDCINLIINQLENGTIGG
ncbi:MAG: hypothetical protein LBR15_01105 [Methanobrevibacter sp.]|jgi:hypothetical protein|nr:hypothetical protein [Candidatus Methanovirga australis]